MTIHERIEAAGGEEASGWQLGHEGARAFERDLVPVFSQPWAADLIATVALRAGETVLDVGCGTGAVARQAAAAVGPAGSVTGVDVNPAMLEVARQVSADSNPPITFQQAGADNLPFEDRSFDAVLAQVVLQFLPDPLAALREMARVLRPGGRLGFSTCRGIEHQPGYLILSDVVTRHVGVEAAEVIRSPYALGDLGQLRTLAGEAGVQNVHGRIRVWTVRFPSAEALLRAETGASPLGDLVAQLDTDVRERLLADLSRALQPHTDDDGVAFPFETVVVTASAA